MAVLLTSIRTSRDTSGFLRTNPPFSSLFFLFFFSHAWKAGGEVLPRARCPCPLGSAVPLCTHLPAGLGWGRGGAHLQKTTFLPEGNPRMGLEEGLGAPAGAAGSGGEQSPPHAGQGPPLPPAERRSTHRSSSPIAAPSLLPKQNDLRIRAQNFFSLQTLLVPSPPGLSTTALFICCSGAWARDAAILGSPCHAARGGGWRCHCLGAATADGDTMGLVLMGHHLAPAAPRRDSLGLPVLAGRKSH